MARPPETIKIMPASPEITRYTLPGFGLPLHFVPREAHEVYGNWEENITYKYPACGEGGELFVTALSDRNIDDGHVSCVPCVSTALCEYVAYSRLASHCSLFGS
jgi:hypothetical protein